MKLRHSCFLAIAVLAATVLIVLFLGFAGGLAGGSGPAMQDAQPDPLTPPVTFLDGVWPVYASGALSTRPYPPRAGEPVRLCAELVNPSTLTFTPTIEISVANFGIGLRFTPINIAPQPVPANGRAQYCAVWVPPIAGDFGVQARLLLPGYPDQLVQRVIDVDEPLQPNVAHSRTFLVFNNTPGTTDISLHLIPHIPDWKMSLPAVLPAMGPFEIRPVALVVTPTVNFPTGEAVVADVEAYNGATLIGGFRKVFRPPLILHRPPDPTYAESEISINPYPPEEREPTEICAALENSSSISQTGTVVFSVAEFGIGTAYHDIARPITVIVLAHTSRQVCVTWVPPFGGLFAAQVSLQQPGLPATSSQRVIDIGEPLQPNTPHARPFIVSNSSSQAVTITLGMIPRVPGWSFQLDNDVLKNMQPNEKRSVTLTATPDNSLPPEGAPVLDVEGYVKDRLIGGFRKIFSPPVPIHQTGDPSYAESEIFMDPYPPRQGEPVRVGVVLRNPTPLPQQLWVQFSYAEFGIGMPYNLLPHPISVTLPANSIVRPGLTWVPPHGGLWCIQVEAYRPDSTIILRSQRNMDVGEPLIPNTPHFRLFPVHNSSTQAVTITLGMISHIPGWSYELDKDVLANLQPHATRSVTLTVTPNNNLPPDGSPVVDVEAYTGGKLLGGFRKLYNPPVTIHHPPEPVYAESEIGVDPYPAVAGKPVQLSILLFNPTDLDRTAQVFFEVGPFGIGMPFNMAGIQPNPLPVFVPAHGAATARSLWTPPPGFAGKFCVRVTVQVPGFAPIWSERNVDVGELLVPGQPNTLLFPLSTGDYTHTITLTLGLISQRPGWQVSLSPSQIRLDKGQVVQASLTVTPAIGTPLGTGAPVADVEAYVEGVLLGGVRKLDIPPLPLHNPFEKGYAESEIVVTPYPPKLGVASWVSATLQNSAPAPLMVDLTFGWAQFGMGIPFSITGMTPFTRSISLGAGESRQVGVQWTPVHSGHQCVHVLLQDHAHIYQPQESQRNVDVVERTFCGKTVTSFTLENVLSIPVTVTLGTSSFNLPPGWGVLVNPAGPLVLQPYQAVKINVTILIPCPTGPEADLPDPIEQIQIQSGSPPTVNVEGYADGVLIGGIQIQFSPTVELPKIYLPLVVRR